MFNLLDILQSQSGSGMQTLGRQYGLSPEQSLKAMEALLPALTLGLQHNAVSDPAGLGRLFGLASGNSRPAAQPPQADMLLGQIFGSPALSQAVLQQASSASGIGTQALRQVLPAMAGMVVAGIVHVMLNQNGAAATTGRDASPEPAEELPAMKFWRDWFANVQAATPGRTPGVGSQLLPPAASQPEQRSGAPAAPVPTASEGLSGGEPTAVFQQMFQTGVQVQEQNAKAMQELFKKFWPTSR